MVQAQAMGRFYAEELPGCVCVRDIFPAGPVAAGSQEGGEMPAACVGDRDGKVENSGTCRWQS